MSFNENQFHDDDEEKQGLRSFSPPPALAWRLVAIPVLSFALILLLSLFSYQATDIPFLNASAKMPANWLGLLGAYLGYYSLLTLGLCAYLIPFYFIWIGGMMAAGRHIRLKPLWGFLTIAFLCALLQFLNSSFAPLLASDTLNIAPNAGGGIGFLLYHENSVLTKAIGPIALGIIYSIALFVFILLSIGPRHLLEAFQNARAERRALIEQAQETALEEASALDRDRNKERAEHKAGAEKRRAKRVAKEDDELLFGDPAPEVATDDATDSAPSAKELRELEKQKRKEERERLRAERAEEKARLKAEREAQKQREKEEREAQRARTKEEKETERLFGKDPDFTAPVAPTHPAAPAAPAPAPMGNNGMPTFSGGSFAPTPAPQSNLPLFNALSEAPAPTPVAPAGDIFASATSFSKPSVDDLAPYVKESSGHNEAEIRERSETIVATFAQFNIQVSVVNVVCGPVITRYEVKPAPGVKVDKMSSYHSNLQMNLRAKSLRIISPIPGKDVVGIEVPNIHRHAVPFRGIAELPEWKTAEEKMAIPMLLGKDVDGDPVLADLAKMPHLIVAGSTGSGKSVCLNSILSGLLLSRTPEELRLILVDPKMVEFTPYADIPHLVVPVITEAPKVAVCLQWAIDEMNRRLKLLKRLGLRKISDFNSRPIPQSLFPDGSGTDSDIPAKLPYIVIVIDEMSDLMMLAGADIEPRIVRIAQLARAVGIHLILATQRPDVHVITGKIKANVPGRIAFKVVGAINSIAILDQGGAEQLIGQGDMLFMNPQSNAILRAQGCWIDDEDIANLNNFYRAQSAPIYVPEIKEKLDRIKIKDSGGTPIKGIEDESEDEVPDAGAVKDNSLDADLQKALDFFVNQGKGKASGSRLQRAFSWGYNRAARIIDELEQRGCIGPANGSSPREVLRTSLYDDTAADPAINSATGDDDF